MFLRIKNEYTIKKLGKIVYDDYIQHLSCLTADQQQHFLSRAALTHPEISKDSIKMAELLALKPAINECTEHLIYNHDPEYIFKKYVLSGYSDNAQDTRKSAEGRFLRQCEDKPHFAECLAVSYFLDRICVAKRTGVYTELTKNISDNWGGDLADTVISMFGRKLTNWLAIDDCRLRFNCPTLWANTLMYLFTLTAPKCDRQELAGELLDMFCRTADNYWEFYRTAFDINSDEYINFLYGVTHLVIGVTGFYVRTADEFLSTGIADCDRMKSSVWRMFKILADWTAECDAEDKLYWDMLCEATVCLSFWDEFRYDFVSACDKLRGAVSHNIISNGCIVKAPNDTPHTKNEHTNILFIMAADKV